MVQAPVSGNEAHVAGWGRPAGPVVSVVRIIMTAAAVGVGGLALWRGHPALAQVSRRALCVHRAAATPCSECIFHRHYVCPSVPTQNERDRLAGWGRRRTYPPVSRTAVNDAHPWKLYTPPGIHVRHLCGNVMYVCHSIRRTDRDNGTAVDIKAHTPLIRFVVDLLT